MTIENQTSSGESRTAGVEAGKSETLADRVARLKREAAEQGSEKERQIIALAGSLGRAEFFNLGEGNSDDARQVELFLRKNNGRVELHATRNNDGHDVRYALGYQGVGEIIVGNSDETSDQHLRINPSARDFATAGFNVPHIMKEVAIAPAELNEGQKQKIADAFKRAGLEPPNFDQPIWLIDEKWRGEMFEKERAHKDYRNGGDNEKIFNEVMAEDMLNHGTTAEDVSRRVDEQALEIVRKTLG